MWTRIHRPDANRLEYTPDPKVLSQQIWSSSLFLSCLDVPPVHAWFSWCSVKALNIVECSVSLNKYAILGEYEIAIRHCIILDIADAVRQPRPLAFRSAVERSS